MHRKRKDEQEESSMAVKHLCEAPRRFLHENKQVQMIITKAKKQKIRQSKEIQLIMCSVFCHLPLQNLYYFFVTET
jgi:hypothetical protein